MYVFACDVTPMNNLCFHGHYLFHLSSNCIDYIIKFLLVIGLSRTPTALRFDAIMINSLRTIMTHALIFLLPEAEKLR